MERRKFIQSGAVATAALLLSRYANAGVPHLKKILPRPGLQLYTMGDLMVNDTVGTLQKIAAIGYKEAESAGSGKGFCYGYKPKEFAAMVKNTGMTWRSAHVTGSPITVDQIMKMAKTAQDSAKIKAMAENFKKMPKQLNLKDDCQELADKAAEGGLGYLVCAFIPVSTMDEIKTAVDVFSKAGEACKKAGVQFAYHNHTTEFDDIDGHKPFNYILDNTDKDHVKMELDLAWATKSNQDPAALFRQYPGRFPLWHVKDLNKVTKEPEEVGAGIVDFKHVFENSGESGMKYYFVEQDGAPHPVQNITHSFNYLKNLLS